MMNNPPSILRYPERTHPSLWRASQLAMAQHPTLPTGFTQLDRELPGRGWPIGSLIEIALEQPGIGEINLLHPALAQLDAQRSIIFIQPPYAPHHQCWVNWGLSKQRLLWIAAQKTSDSLWACNKILQHNACSALFCWVSNAPAQALRRLHLAARQSNTLFFMLRSLSDLNQPSVAPLRLRLQPSAQGLQLNIIKRSGPFCEHAIPIELHPKRLFSSTSYHPRPHVTLDQSAPTHPQPGRGISLLAH